MAARVEILLLYDNPMIYYKISPQVYHHIIKFGT